MERKFLAMYHWSDDVAESFGILIQQKLNEGRAYGMGPFLVDNICQQKNVYKIKGCYFHGHDSKLCEIMSRIRYTDQLTRRTK